MRTPVTVLVLILALSTIYAPDAVWINAFGRRLMGPTRSRRFSDVCTQIPGMPGLEWCAKRRPKFGSSAPTRSGS